jgi:ribosome-binding protein aMBF1 (putative translation factor)
MAKTRDALTILDRLTGPDRELRRRIAEETTNSQVARMIHDARTKAGLSQRQLAELIGTKQPVIARLEDANYPGHSLSMLQRIATALKKRLDIRLVSVPRNARAA